MNAVSSLALAYANAVEPTPDHLMTGFPPAPSQRVTWANWMAPPFNRWGFRHLQQLRPTITVAAGQGPVATLQDASVGLEGFAFESTCGQAVTLAQHLFASHTDGFLVMQGDEVRYERYFNGQQPNDRHIMFSVTKSLIGTLAEQLIADGTLAPQSMASRYVPEFVGSAFAEATVRQLLDMSIGIDYTEQYDDPCSESSLFGYACGFMPTPAGVPAFESLYTFLPTLRQRGEHGGRFHYVTATTEALAWVMERAAGQSCAQLLAPVWAALGCQRDAYFMADPWGRPVAGAGFNATLRDMARLGRLLANRGECNGMQLLPAAVIDGIAKGADPQVYAANQDFSQWTPGASYRSQWYVFNDHSRALMAGGIHGQYLFVDLPSRTVIVKQSSLPTAVGDFDADSVRLMRALAAHFTR